MVAAGDLLDDVGGDRDDDRHAVSDTAGRPREVDDEGPVRVDVTVTPNQRPTVTDGALLLAADDVIVTATGSDPEGDPRGVVVGRSMTALTFEMARTLAQGWGPGDEVVVTRLDHDSNIRPWVLAAQRAGATVRWLDFDPVTAEREQWDDGNNTLAIAPRVAVAYERNDQTNERLEEAGIEVVRIPLGEQVHRLGVGLVLFPPFVYLEVLDVAHRQRLDIRPNRFGNPPV